MRGPSIRRNPRGQSDTEQFTVRLSIPDARQIRQMANDRSTKPGILIREFVLQELQRIRQRNRRRPPDTSQ